VLYNSDQEYDISIVTSVVKSVIGLPLLSVALISFAFHQIASCQGMLGIAKVSFVTTDHG
jgi:hypothetical protein